MEGGIQEKHLRDFTDAAHGGGGGGRRIFVYIWSGVWRSQPPPPHGMVWYGVGGGGLACAERVRAVGAAAGETAGRHRPGQHSTQALRKP